MADGEFDNLTVNLLSKLKGYVGIGTPNPGAKLEVNLKNSPWVGTQLLEAIRITPPYDQYGRYWMDLCTYPSGGDAVYCFRTTDKHHHHIRNVLTIDDFGGTLKSLADFSGTGSAGRVTINGYLYANGDINVTGDIILKNADCAEEFDVAGVGSVEPGTVMVIDKDGALHPCENAYDKRVAGVISGAGDLRPGIILNKQSEKTNRLPLALTGKVYCKTNAEYGSVEVGDLLTTSPTCGHAMKADDPFKAFGSVIGKALCPMETGQGIIPILVALQ